MGASFLSSFMLAGVLSGATEFIGENSAATFRPETPAMSGMPAATPAPQFPFAASAYAAEPAAAAPQTRSADSGSWAYPAVFAVSVTGLLLRRRHHQKVRERQDAVKREVGQWLDQAGSLGELVKREEIKSGPIYFAHRHPVRTPGQAKQALAAYRQFEKIGFYLASLSASPEAKMGEVRCLRHKTVLAHKLHEYAHHIHAELTRLSLQSKRDLLHLGLLSRDHTEVLTLIAAFRSPVEDTQPFFAKSAERALGLLHKMRREAVLALCVTGQVPVHR